MTEARQKTEPQPSNRFRKTFAGDSPVFTVLLLVAGVQFLDAQEKSLKAHMPQRPHVLFILPRSKEIEGTSLVPLLRNPGAPRAEPAVMTWEPNCHAVRAARWRYIRYADGAEELYDHQNDAYEWTNLANRPEHNETKQRLAQSLPKINKPLTTRTQWLPPSLLTRGSPAPPSAKTDAIIVDDEQGVFTGEWILSAKQPALVGKGYRHDGNTGRGEKFAVFTPEIPQAGHYEVRVLFTPGVN
ncbi:MAG: hypothetical protein N3B01_12195, partial [Verrucomicrobiae bacterium]|nr:hypothetical protein [Verrucomicrobiae bacterium]